MAGTPNRATRDHVVLTVTRLEDRITPVVGATAQPAPIAPGGAYDGVVWIIMDNPEGGITQGTGSLIQGSTSLYGNYILTAAHIASKGTGDVLFDLPLGNRTHQQQIPGTVRIDIPVRVGNGYGAVAPEWVNDPDDFKFWDNDIAVMRLVDPISPAPDRLLVPPKGAQAYLPYSDYYSGEEFGHLATFVGYGRTGVGQTGQTVAADGKKRLAQNLIEYDRWLTDATYLGENLGGNDPKALVVDFDNGANAHDAFGVVESRHNLGMGAAEGVPADGDSGGPWFALDGSGTTYIVGVGSLSSRYPPRCWVFTLSRT